MKAWLKKNKLHLIILAALSLIFFFMTGFLISYISNPYVLEDLNQYIENNEISPALKKYVVLVVIDLLIFAVWAIFFLIIMWKVFFPNKKTVHEAFQMDTLGFLYGLPSSMKKELKRHE